jgi:hypothetical protein
MTTLYEITADFRALEELLETQAESGEADADVVAHWLEELSGALTDKVDRCVCYIKSQEALESAAKAEAARMQARAAVHAGRVERLKAALRFALDTQGLARVEAPHGTVSIQKNGGQQKMTIPTIDAVPGAFVKQVPTLDADAARAALEAAPGQAAPWGHLEPRGSHVRVR